MQDDFPRRLRECIGDEPVAAFARRCGFSEGLIRAYLKDGKRPGMDYLVRMADAAGVSLEWLATGREPKRRISTGQPLQVIEGEGKKAPEDQDIARLMRAIEGTLAAMPDKDAARRLAHDLYARAQEVSEQHTLRQAIEDLRAQLAKLTGTGA